MSKGSPFYVVFIILKYNKNKSKTIDKLDVLMYNCLINWTNKGNKMYTNKINRAFALQFIRKNINQTLKYVKHA
jgi:hypothetical protein